MLNMVKDLITSVGGPTGSFAKTVGLSSAGLAKSVGAGSVALAKDIGHKRALIGAAVAGAAIVGSVLLVRYLRARKQERLDHESMEASDDATRRNSRMARAESRAVNAAMANR
jgi:hypothetical protein